AMSAAAVDRMILELSLVTFTLGSAQAAVLPAAWERLRYAVGHTLDRFHKERPDLPGIGIEELRKGGNPPLPQPLLLAALRKLAESGELSLDRTWVRRPGHAVRFSAEEERVWALVLPRLRGEPYRPPRVRDIAKAMALEEAFVRRLMRLAARRGDVEEIAQDHFFATGGGGHGAHCHRRGGRLANGHVHGRPVSRPTRQRPQGGHPDSRVL